MVNLLTVNTLFIINTYLFIIYYWATVFNIDLSQYQYTKIVLRKLANIKVYKRH